MAMRTATPLVTCCVTTVARQVSHIRGDLDPPHHRARVRDDGVVSQKADPARGEAPAGRVLTQTGDKRTTPPFGLEPQQRDHVRVAQGGIEIGRHGRQAIPPGRAGAGCPGRPG